LLKTGLSAIVVCPTGRHPDLSQDVAMEERPNAQDRKISAVWQAFFRRARKLVGSCHFAHLWRTVVALAAMQGRRSMRKLEASCRHHTTRQSIGFFLSKAHWDAPQVTLACEAQNYRWVGVAKKNRNFFPDGRPHDKRKLSSYGANALQRLGTWKSHDGKKYRLAERVGRLSKLGRVKLVFSRRAKDKSRIAMATNETRWGAVRVLLEYLKRWSIDVLFKESKQYLGLGDYQTLRYRGVVRYLHLVLIAHLLLNCWATWKPSTTKRPRARCTLSATTATPIIARGWRKSSNGRT
jgi:hypothetical protein